MKQIGQFFATTILGGVVFLTPLVVLAIVVSKAYGFARRSLQPMAGLIPDGLAPGPTVSAILAVLVLALACFLAGLIAQTLWAKRLVRGLEGSVLSMIPGYEYLKQAGTSVLGLGETAAHPVVLVDFGGSSRIGILTDGAEGDLVAVFIPNAPNPTAGSVFLMPQDRVRRVDAPLASAIGCLRRCGTGASTVVATLSALP